MEFKVTSLYSPDLANPLQNGEIDLGFLRVEPQPDVDYQVVAKEPLVVILPSDHRLAQQVAVDPHDLAGKTFIGFTDVPHVLRKARSAAVCPSRDFHPVCCEDDRGAAQAGSEGGGQGQLEPGIREIQ